ncbi:MFS transporter [Balneolales bacterium ANBcel1]|nr:MFS transporter [Balneolales bacterium ANBcel1]
MLASTLTVMSGATIGPVLPLMSEVFADTPNAAFLTRLILTMPALFIVLFSTLCGYLVDRHGRKNILLMATLLYGISGSAGLWLDSLTAILISRAMLGMSVAGVMTVCITLIGDYYSGDERQYFAGLQSAFMAFGGVVFISASGVLADISWRAPFLIYTMAFLLLPAIALIITEPPVNRGSDSEPPEPRGTPDTSPPPSPTSFPKGIITLIIGSAFAGMAIFYMIPVHMPFFINSFGDVSNTAIGFALASFVLTGAIVALNYQRFLVRMSYASIYLLCFFLLGTGYILISFAGSYHEIFAGMVLGGFGSGLLMPNSNVWMLSEAPAHLRGRLSGTLTSAVFLGQFLSPILTQPMVDATSIDTGFLIIGLTVASAALLVTIGYLVYTSIRSRIRPR